MAEVCAVMNVMQQWGMGNFTNDKAAETAEATWNEDCTLDATANVKTTDIYKPYTGRQGVLDWVAALDQIEFKDFTPSLVGVADGKVFMKATYTPVLKSSGKAMGPQEDIHSWTVKDGKISEAKFFWGNTKDLEELWG